MGDVYAFFYGNAVARVGVVLQNDLQYLDLGTQVTHPPAHTRTHPDTHTHTEAHTQLQIYPYLKAKPMNSHNPHRLNRYSQTRPVKLKDFYIADQLTSLSIVLVDMEVRRIKH